MSRIGGLTPARPGLFFYTGELAVLFPAVVPYNPGIMKTALITGASCGIGAACATALADRGIRVCLIARRRERLEEVVSRINAKHGPDRAIHFAGDVTDDSVRRRAWQHVLDRWAAPDILVNNAGYALGGAVEDVSLDAVRQQFEVNFFAYLAWMQLAGPIMRQRRAGRIINVSSVSGLVALAGLGLYSASKFAVEALSDAARREYRPWGVKVILVEPGSIVTDIWQNSLNMEDSLRCDWQTSAFRDIYEREKQYARKLIDGHGPKPQIVARAVCHAATARWPRLRYCVPWDARIAGFLSRLPTRVQDWILALTIK